MTTTLLLCAAQLLLAICVVAQYDGPRGTTGSGQQEIYRCAEPWAEVGRLTQELEECRKNCPTATFTCPPGFVTLSGTEGCYRVIEAQLTWADAQQRCIDVNPNAHLVVVNDAAEDTAIVDYLKSLVFPGTTCACYLNADSKCFWTSGQRSDPNDCSTPYVWKPSPSEVIPFSYASWSGGQPDCFGGENSVEYRSAFVYKMNDFYNYAPACPICEYRNPV